MIFGLAMIVMMIFRTQGILPPTPRTYPVGDAEKAEVHG